LIGVLLVAAGVGFYFTTGWAPVAVADPPMLLEKKLAHGALNARSARIPTPTRRRFPLNEVTYLAGGDVYKAELRCLPRITWRKPKQYCKGHVSQAAGAFSMARG